MDEDWCLPGYEVHGRIGGGPGEDRWRGRELDTGDTVVLERLPGDETGETLVAWQQEAARHEAVRSPHVVRLRAVLSQGGDIVLVRDHAGGGTLDVLVARRGQLEPGEVVTIGVALAQALSALSAAGLASGGLTPEQVLFRDDGMPLLLCGGEAVQVQEPDPAADVVALARLCSRLVGPAAPWQLRDVLTAGANGALAAGDLAVALRRAYEPSPVLRGAAPRVAAATAGGQVAPAHPLHAAPRTRRRARERPSPRVLLATAAALVLLVAGGALAGAWSGAWSGRGAAEPVTVSTAPAAPRSDTPGSAAEWEAVLDRLDAARAVAFGRADAALLTAAYVPGSPGQQADARLVRSLARRGLTAQGVRHRVGDVDVVSATQDRARLRVVDTLAPYTVRDANGEVVGRSAARSRTSHVVDLARTGHGWRLVEVRRG